jgi:uncharacterized protein (TIGR02453 family)
MPEPQIPESSLDFLKLLRENNNRDWFNEHKYVFTEEQARVEQFAGALLTALNRYDVIETPGKKILHRIYRDTRFSKEKIPYKTNWSGNYKRAGKERRGGYYFHLEPGNSFVAGGFQAPNAPDLKLIREEISFDASALRKILNSKPFKQTFGTLQGEQVSTAPKGFDKNNEAIDLLRYKQFLLIRRFTDEQVLSPSFLTEAVHTFRNMLPFFDYMSGILGSDGDGTAV